jgi:hypothetical protein
MIKKNILWLSEINPDYQNDNALLRKLKNDNKVELRNIRHCFEPVMRQEELKSAKESEGNIKTVSVEASLESLFRESYYADAVVMSKSLYKDHLYPLHIKDIHCPIVLFPEETSKINHLLFVITSNPDSVISIKQFCCLFEHICKKAKMTLLVYDDGDGIQKPDEQILVNYLKKWNRNLGVYKDQNWNYEQLVNYLEFDEKTMCVMNLSLILNASKGSFPSEIFKNNETSLFIGFNY